MDLSLTQFLIILVTIALVIGGGIYAAHSVKSAEGYSLGGRAAGVPLVAGSIAGTCVGGGATVGTAQLASTIGLSAWWFTIGTGLSLILMGLFYARPLRRTSLETISQYLVLNYGKASGTFTSVVSSTGILFSTVASCLPGIQILMVVFGISDWAAAGILLLLVASYSFFGGMKSAGVGGILKMIIIWVSLFIAGSSAIYAIHTQPELTAALPDHPWFSLFGNGVSNALTNLFSLIVGMLCTQSYIQAIFSASNPRTASIGAFMAALITIPVGLPCAMIGMYMHAAHPEVSPILVLPTYLLEYQPTLIGAVAMGGIVLSLIGSIAGLSLGIGTMLSRDILTKAFHVTKPQSQLQLTRAVVLGVIFLSSIIAILNEDSQVLFWTYLSMALRGGGIFLPLTLAIFRPHAVSGHWAITSMVVSTLTAIAAAILYPPVNPLFIGLVLSCLLLLPGYLQNKAHPYAEHSLH